MKREIGNPMQADYSHTNAFAEISTFLGKICSLFSAEKPLLLNNCCAGEGNGEGVRRNQLLD